MDTNVGQINWVDLTVSDAEGLRDFYSRVAGWTFEPHDMEGYDDFVMKSADGKSVAGVCHARDTNADVPPQWLVYITVADLDASLATVRELGGEMIGEFHGNRYAIIRDPAGAVCALYQPGAAN